jgi:hypothetical protein
MKILYVSHNNHLDYQDDCLFIGLKELFGCDVVDVNKKHHSYNTFSQNLENFHGKGMTVTKVLEDLEVDRDDISNKIKNKYFDYVIYGSITRCKDFLDEVLEKYSKNKIIFIDGEDNSSINPIHKFGNPYFKRELTVSNQNIFPISFAIPTCKVNFNKNKIKDKAFITPKDLSTYIYKDETSYYNDYNEAKFGFTMKKAGWDCLRHYEIMANGCIPYFDNIENCPNLTMTSFPKQLCIDAKNDLKIMSPSKVYDKYITHLEVHFFENNTTKINSKKFIDFIQTF